MYQGCSRPAFDIEAEGFFAEFLKLSSIELESLWIQADFTFAITFPSESSSMPIFHRKHPDLNAFDLVFLYSFSSQHPSEKAAE